MTAGTGSVLSVPPTDELAPARDESRPPDAGELPDARLLLAAAVAGIGGAERPGQVTMAEAVERSLRDGGHLAVQAGTGTGKSLAYLVPAAAHAMASGTAVVVATATIALQRQLVDRDLPRLSDALTPLLGRPPVFAILKGRRNYLCLHRLRSGAAGGPGGHAVRPGRGVRGRPAGAAAGRVGRPTSTGDRDELVPGVDDRAWRQVSVPAPECIGAQRCPFGSRCFAEQAREAAGQADIVVTNHALLAIDALEDFPVLPEHDVVIIDEAHDLVNRVTSQAAAELSAAAPETAARRCGRLVSAGDGRPAAGGGRGDRPAVPGRPRRAGWTCWPSRWPSRWPRSGTPRPAAPPRSARRPRKRGEDAGELARGPGRAGRAATTCSGRPSGSWPRSARTSRPGARWSGWTGRAARPRRPATLRVAPLEVGGLLAERLFGRRRWC